VLVLGGAAALGAVSLSGTCAAPDPGGRLPDGLFSLGVSSGDPLPDGIVLWTRLAPEPLALDGRGGMPQRTVPLRWEIADDEGFRRVVRRGTAWAHPEDAHTVHVDVRGLAPGRWYFYRFAVADERSPVGRTRTAPAPGTTGGGLTFALASCQHYPTGYYTSYRNMLDEDLDLVVHVGDYIYEGGYQGDLGRGHLPSREIRSLADYRVRHAQYKTDPDLQAVHAAAPVTVTWDDHEVANNWANGDADPDAPTEQFRRRKAAAFQAYYEHMPLRRAQRPDGAQMLLYRRLPWGDLASLTVLDTRQYRSDQVPCRKADCAEAFDPSRVMLGGEQQAWLLNGLAGSPARWNVLAQQVPFFGDSTTGLGPDKWDGYRVARQQILDLLSTGRVPNPVVLTGDIHSNLAVDLKADFQNPESATVGSEFVGTSITSFGNARATANFDPSADNPQIKFSGNGRGYVICRLSPQAWRADYRVVDTVEQPESGVQTAASFVIEAGRRGLQRV